MPTASAETKKAPSFPTRPFESMLGFVVCGLAVAAAALRIFVNDQLRFDLITVRLACALQVQRVRRV
jgi:hypothetical protein